ncbi:MAG: hypothetical protein P4L40_08695 [Terracidiphilus sp.]|nr:hypothetical protein [Terracidiphilus sp.]
MTSYDPGEGAQRYEEDLEAIARRIAAVSAVTTSPGVLWAVSPSSNLEATPPPLVKLPTMPTVAIPTVPDFSPARPLATPASVFDPSLWATGASQTPGGALGRADVTPLPALDAVLPFSQPAAPQLRPRAVSPLDAPVFTYRPSQPPSPPKEHVHTWTAEFTLPASAGKRSVWVDAPADASFASPNIPSPPTLPFAQGATSGYVATPAPATHPRISAGDAAVTQSSLLAHAHTQSASRTDAISHAQGGFASTVAQHSSLDPDDVTSDDDDVAGLHTLVEHYAR